MLIRYSITADARASTVYHKRVTCVTMITITSIWKARVDRQVFFAKWIEAALCYSVEALGCLPISRLTLWSQFAAELTDRIGLNTSPASGTLPPQFQFVCVFDDAYHRRVSRTCCYRRTRLFNKAPLWIITAVLQLLVVRRHTATEQHC